MKVKVSVFYRCVRRFYRNDSKRTPVEEPSCWLSDIFSPLLCCSLWQWPLLASLVKWEHLLWCLPGKKNPLVANPLVLVGTVCLFLRNIRGCNSLRGCKVGRVICIQAASTPSKNSACLISRKTSAGNQTICSNLEGKSTHTNAQWASYRLKWLVRRPPRSIN